MTSETQAQAPGNLAGKVAVVTGAARGIGREAAVALARRGASVAGFDVQLVHTDIDWAAGLRWQDDVRVAVSTAHVGSTSFALDFQTRRHGEPTCTARTVYVVIATDGSGKRPIPPVLATALGDPAPLRSS